MSSSVVAWGCGELMSSSSTLQHVLSDFFSTEEGSSSQHLSKSAVAWGPVRSFGRVPSFRQSTAYVSMGFTGGLRPVPQMKVAPRST